METGDHFFTVVVFQSSSVNFCRSHKLIAGLGVAWTRRRRRRKKKQLRILKSTEQPEPLPPTFPSKIVLFFCYFIPSARGKSPEKKAAQSWESPKLRCSVSTSVPSVSQSVQVAASSRLQTSPLRFLRRKERKEWHVSRGWGVCVNQSSVCMCMCVWVCVCVCVYEWGGKKKNPAAISSHPVSLKREKKKEKTKQTKKKKHQLDNEILTYPLSVRLSNADTWRIPQKLITKHAGNAGPPSEPQCLLLLFVLFTVIYSQRIKHK